MELLRIYLIFSEHSDKIKDNEAALYNDKGEAEKFIKANKLEAEFKQKIPALV